MFGSTCYVRDVRPSVTKLDPKALKCVFLGYSRLQKGYRCYSVELGKYLVSTDVVFSEATPFFYAPPISTSQVKEDEWLVYQITHAKTKQLDDDVLPSTSSFIENESTIMPSTIMPSEPVSSVPIRPPIVQVYSRRQGNDDTCPTSTPSPSVPPPLNSSGNVDFLLLFGKVHVSVNPNIPLITLFLMLTYLLHLVV